MKSFLVLAMFFSLSNVVLAQNQESTFYFSSSSAVQYGYSLKAMFTFPANKDDRVQFRAGFSGGIGAFTGNNWFYPSLNADLMMYHGGIGSSRPGIRKKNGVDIDLILAYTFTAGWCNRMSMESSHRPGERNYPLYYFNNWNHPALQNPYNYSLSWGGNFIFMLTREPQRAQQLVGFLNAHADRFQISYYNDGPPFFPPFGDKFDRYYTGGGFLSFHGNNRAAINLVEVGFNKFTGYSAGAYEVSNRLGNSYVFYKDSNENFFNKSNIQITVANTTVAHAGFTINLFNDDWLDVQHRIHTDKFYSLHLVPYKKSWSVGPVGYYCSTHIGLQ